MNRNEVYLRSVIFGITDSLVSTVGLLAGIDVAGASHNTIVLTGLVYAFVEAFSMAVGNFLSEKSADEYRAGVNVSDGGPLIAGVVMFISFVVAAFIPLAPYLYFGDPYAFPTSLGVSLVALFLTGIMSARFARLPLLVRGFRMALLGGAAILIGAVVGVFVRPA